MVTIKTATATFPDPDPDTDLPLPGEAPGAPAEDDEPELAALEAEDGGAGILIAALLLGVVVVAGR